MPTIIEQTFSVHPGARTSQNYPDRIALSRMEQKQFLEMLQMGFESKFPTPGLDVLGLPMHFYISDRVSSTSVWKLQRKHTAQ